MAKLTETRSFARIGTAYEKQGDLAQAIEYYNKSLTEHRTPDTLTKLRNAEKTKIQAEKESYVDPAEAEKARELGQKKFQEGDWPAAVDAFSEMVKRAPDDVRGFSNRAAALIKLMAFPQAVQDCDDAISRDVKFIRAYMRKAQALVAMKEYNRALDVCTEAQEHDDGSFTREIEQQSQKCLESQFSARAGETEQQTMERIQNDPEVPPPITCPTTELTETDHVDSPRPSHAKHPATGQERPSGPPGAHEERTGADKDPEVDGCGCDPHGTVVSIAHSFSSISLLHGIHGCLVYLLWLLCLSLISVPKPLRTIEAKAPRGWLDDDQCRVCSVRV